MSFELRYVLPQEKSPPDQAKIQAILAKLPHTKKWVEPVDEEEERTPGYTLKKKEKAKSPFHWQYEYLNPETGVVCTFRHATPNPDTTQFRGQRDSGLTCVVPFLCPTFVAREALPIVEQVGRALNLGALTPSGELVPDSDAGRLQIVWTEGNRKTLERFGIASGQSMPPYFARERLDEMWRYMNARHTMETRYAAKGIYVPRIVLIRNKLDRKRIFLAAMWTEIAPAVIPPEVDAFVIGKPVKTLFGLLKTGDIEPVVVKAEVVMKHITPLLRNVDRPIPHRLLEDPAKARNPILKDMAKVLTPAFTTFETVAIEEVVDIQV